MPDEIKANEGATQQRQDSQKASESNSNNAPNIYTVGTPEYKKHIEDIISQYGDRVKREKIDPISAERDSLKTNEVALNGKIASLEAQIKVIQDAGGDPAKLAQKLKEVEARELTAAEGLKEVTAFKRGKLIREVAALYENGDPEALTKAADRFSVSTKEGLQGLAEEKGWKLKEALKPPDNPAIPSLQHVDSGGTNGGGVDVDKLSPTEKIKYGLEQSKKKK